MSNKHFIGLVHSVLSSAEAALGEVDSPLTMRLANDGILARKTAERSLALLTMLQTKTLGNLDETERDVLTKALAKIQSSLERLESADTLN